MIYILLVKYGGMWHLDCTTYDHDEAILLKHQMQKDFGSKKVKLIGNDRDNLDDIQRIVAFHNHTYV